MSHGAPEYPHGSPAARSLFAYIHQRGGTMRIAPLMRRIGMDQPTVVDAINELVDRGWLKIVWRKSAREAFGKVEALPMTDADRLVATRGGRYRYRSTWPSY